MNKKLSPVLESTKLAGLFGVGVVAVMFLLGALIEIGPMVYRFSLAAWSDKVSSIPQVVFWVCWATSVSGMAGFVWCRSLDKRVELPKSYDSLLIAGMLLSVIAWFVGLLATCCSLDSNKNLSPYQIGSLIMLFLPVYLTFAYCVERMLTLDD